MYTTFSVPFASPEYDELLDLRYKVLREPLGLEFKVEDLAKEHADLHLGIFDANHRALGCASLSDGGEGVALMRQVAVLPAYQGKGVGRKLVAAFEREALRLGFASIRLAARDEAIPFYTKLGYRLCSEGYSKIGIAHHDMQKELRMTNDE